MADRKFIRHLQIGEYVASPEQGGIDSDMAEYTELTIDENWLWCKRERKLDFLAGWAEKLEDGVLTVVVNPVLVKLGGADVVIGAEVEFESIGEFHCEECNEVIHTHIDCPICLIKWAGTDLSGGVYEQLAEYGPFPLKCDECKTVFNVQTIDVGCIRALIGTEPDEAVLVKRSKKRLKRLLESNAPTALVESEKENLKNLEEDDES